jgi:hypothetical protein
MGCHCDGKWWKGLNGLPSIPRKVMHIFSESPQNELGRHEKIGITAFQI